MGRSPQTDGGDGDFTTERRQTGVVGDGETDNAMGRSPQTDGGGEGPDSLKSSFKEHITVVGGRARFTKLPRMITQSTA